MATPISQGSLSFEQQISFLLVDLIELLTLCVQLDYRQMRQQKVRIPHIKCCSLPVGASSGYMPRRGMENLNRNTQNDKNESERDKKN
jgi:hypothetical protein